MTLPVDALESEHAKLEKAISEPAFYEQDHELVARTLRELESLAKELNDSYERWDELDVIRTSRSEDR